MKRKVTREKELPAFKIDLIELGLLQKRCRATFDRPDEVRFSINIRLVNEKLMFASVAEMEAYEHLPDKVTDFSLWFSQDDRRIFLLSTSLLGMVPEVSAEGEAESWSAGAVETVYSFLNGHKTSYDWLTKLPIGWLIIFFGFLLAMFPLILKSELIAESALAAITLSWLSLSVAVGLLFLTRHRVFPMMVLQVRQSEGFIRRHAGELSLAVAVTSAILTVVGWFFAK